MQKSGRADELPGLAEQAACQHGVTTKELRNARHRGKVSAAPRELIRVAVVKRGIRPIDVSRYLDGERRWAPRRDSNGRGRLED